MQLDKPGRWRNGRHGCANLSGEQAGGDQSVHAGSTDTDPSAPEARVYSISQLCFLRRGIGCGSSRGLASTIVEPPPGILHPGVLPPPSSKDLPSFIVEPPPGIMHPDILPPPPGILQPSILPPPPGIIQPHLSPATAIGHITTKSIDLIGLARDAPTSRSRTSRSFSRNPRTSRSTVRDVNAVSSQGNVARLTWQEAVRNINSLIAIAESDPRAHGLNDLLELTSKLQSHHDRMRKITQKAAILHLQSKARSRLARCQLREITQKAAILHLQSKARSRLARCQLTCFQYTASAKIIQSCWRVKRAYWHRVACVTCIQKWWRRFLTQRRRQLSAVVIQKWWRECQLFEYRRQQLIEYVAAVLIQRVWLKYAHYKRHSVASGGKHQLEKNNEKAENVSGGANQLDKDKKNAQKKRRRKAKADPVPFKVMVAQYTPVIPDGICKAVFSLLVRDCDTLGAVKIQVLECVRKRMCSGGIRAIEESASKLKLEHFELLSEWHLSVRNPGRLEHIPDDAESLTNCGVVTKPVLFMNVKMLPDLKYFNKGAYRDIINDKVRVYVHCTKNDERTWEFDMPPTATMLDVKRFLSDRSGIRAKSMMLLFVGTVPDDTDILAYFLEFLAFGKLPFVLAVQAKIVNDKIIEDGTPWKAKKISWKMSSDELKEVLSDELKEDPADEAARRQNYRDWVESRHAMIEKNKHKLAQLPRDENGSGILKYLVLEAESPDGSLIATLSPSEEGDPLLELLDNRNDRRLLDSRLLVGLGDSIHDLEFSKTHCHLHFRGFEVHDQRSLEQQYHKVHYYYDLENQTLHACDF